MSEHSLDFLTRFCLTAILGSAVIIGVAPMIRPKTLPVWLEDPSRQVRAIPVLSQAADSLAQAFLWSPTARRQRQAAAAAAATAAPVVPKWGVINHDRAPAYRQNGKFWQRLPAGTALTILGMRQSTAGEVALCQFAPPAAPADDGFLIRGDQLNVHLGDLGSLGSDKLEQQERYARLQAELGTLRQAQNSVARTDNPNWSTYQSAKELYTSYGKRVQDLEQRANAATNDERAQYLDELRRMRGDGVELLKAYETAHRQYMAWNASHPRAADSSNPRIREVESEIASLAPQVQDAVATP